MFKLTPNPTFKANVPLTVPGEESPVAVKFSFRHKTLVAAQKWYESNEGKLRADALDELIAGWEGIEDEQGAPVDYSKDALTALLANYPAATGEITTAYWRELTASRIKN